MAEDNFQTGHETPSTPSSQTTSQTTSQMSDSTLTHASAADLGAEIPPLAQMRQEWEKLRAAEPIEGDARYVVPRLFLDNVLAADADSLADLVANVGHLDCSSVVDQNGILYPADAEPTPLMHISPELFHQLSSHFDVQGEPVIRSVIVEDGLPVLERFPPFFVVHSLTKAATATTRGAAERLNAHGRCAFLLSQSKSFQDLVDTIQTYMFKAKSMTIRVWFITSDDVEDLPAAIPVPVFVNKIQHKKLIVPSIMSQTLKSQGVRTSRIHLVAETMERTTRKFILDQVIASTNFKLLDFLAISSTGGNLGLSNLGNTCYMNSALQCLVHIPEVNYYFLFDLYERELNRTNPLGNKGEIAIAFSNLLHKLFDITNTSTSYITPREFKYTIGRFSSMFHGYQQQDSQEFLSWLLDALHEDLNRIHNKPYLEKPELKDEDVLNPQAITDLANECWSQHKQRNDSVIIDLFTGLYQSTLVCPTCSKMSVTFDPFNDLTLPLPVNKKWYHKFTIVDLSEHAERKRLMTLEVELNKSSNYDDLLQYLSDFLKVPKEQLFLFEIFRNFFYKSFQDVSGSYNFLPVSELITDADVIAVYIIPHDPETDMIVPVLNTVQDEDKSYNVAEPFGIPLFIVLKDDEVFSLGKIRSKLERAVGLLTTADLAGKYSEYKGVSEKKFFSAEDFPLIKRDRMLDDTVMIDGDAENISAEVDGYDSDISLAHPSVGASFGFEIKSSEEDSPSGYAHGGRFNRHLGSLTGESSSLPYMHIPRSRPHFNRLTVIADKLPELKRNYYHYSDFSAKVDAERERLAQQSSSEDEGHGYVMVDPQSDAITKEDSDKSNPSSEREPQVLGDESDSDSNWDTINPLLNSVDQLNGPPGAPAIDSDKDVASELQSPGSDPEVTKMSKHEKLVTNKTTLVLSWDRSIYDEFFNDHESQAWENMPSILNPTLEASKRKLAIQQKATISLYDCLRNFNTPEVLGDQDLWYCPRCKDHKRATKTIQIWSTGDILTIHLKRFQSARSFSDKINMVVDFPIEGLDMSEFVSSETEGGLLYDLIAVDNHYGGLGGGHYTAAAKNFRDGKWYYFNDGRVSPIEDPKQCVTDAAYLLFYKKRTSDKFVGGDKVEELLGEGKNVFEQKLNNLRSQLLQIRDEIALYQKQEQEEKEQKEQPVGVVESEPEEDLYEDEGPIVPSVTVTGSKKSRSPMAEQSMKFEFENQRKQRLISKNPDLAHSVNINMGYSSSVSNLASPTESSDEDAGSAD